MNNGEQWSNESGEKPQEKKFQVLEGSPDHNATEEDNLMFELFLAFEEKDYGYGEFTERQLDDFISSKIAETPLGKKEEMEKLLAKIRHKILTNPGYLATEKPYSIFIKE